MNADQLPRAMADVTSNWLTRALASAAPEVEVWLKGVDEVIHGTSTKAKLSLEYNRAGKAAGLPEKMWIKGGFDLPEEHFNLFAAENIYTTEVRFYREFADRVPVRVPQCYYAQSDGDRQGVILLEAMDVPGSFIADATQEVSVDQVAAMLDTLAKLHAQWWGSPELEKMNLRIPLEQDTGINYFNKVANPERLAERFAGPRGKVVPVEVQQPERIHGLIPVLAGLVRQKPLCYIHGDAHVGNTGYTDAGGTFLLDWQAIRKAHWALDYAYYVVSALKIEDRRHAEKDLLKHYLERLAAYDVEAPSFDEAWLDYRRFILYGLVVWVGNPESSQVEEVNITSAAKFAAAAADLQTLDALGSH